MTAADTAPSPHRGSIRGFAAGWAIAATTLAATSLATTATAGGSADDAREVVAPPHAFAQLAQRFGGASDENRGFGRRKPPAGGEGGDGFGRPKPQAPDPETIAQRQRESALRLARIGRLRTPDARIEAARQELAAHPGDPFVAGDVAFLIASAQYQGGRLLEAGETIDAALSGRLPPVKRMPLLVVRGNIAYSAGRTRDLEGVVAEQDELIAQVRRTPPWAAIEHAWTAFSNRTRTAVHFLKGDLPAAELSARTAVAAAEQHLAVLAARGTSEAEREELAANTSMLQATEADLTLVLTRRGKLVEAEAVARRALGLARLRSGAQSGPTARALGFLAQVLAERGRYAEAESVAREAIAAAGAMPATATAMVEIRATLGHALALQEKWQEAADVFQQRFAAFQGQPDLLRSVRLGHPSWILALIQTGRHGEALKRLEGIRRRVAGFAGTESFVLAMYGGLEALALLESGRTAAALERFREVVPKLLEQAFANLREERDGPARVTRLNYILEGYMRALLRQHGSEAPSRETVGEMFRIADFARGSHVQRALTLGAARAAARDPALAGLVEREETLGRRLATLNDVLQGLSAASGEKRLETVIAAMTRDIAEAGRARDALRQEIRDKHPEYAELVAPRPISLENARAVLGADEALISIYAGRRESYVWAVTRDRPVAFTVARLDAAQADAVVKGLRRALDVGAADLAAFPKYDVAGAAALYDALLRPLESTWKPAKQLIVAPHRALGQVPFGLLTTAESSLESDDLLFGGYRRIPWLLRSHAITQVPAVAAIVALRRLPPPAAGRLAFAGFGDPVFGADQPASGAATGTTRGVRLRTLLVGAAPPPATAPGIAPSVGAAATPDPGVFERLAPLPDTALEVREIASAMRADPTRDVFLGKRATEANVRTTPLRDRRVVMFATHGLVPAELPGLTQPALALSNPKLVGEDGDGLLTLEEVLELRLDADWVVLSACNTASADGAGGEAVSGLGRAFFFSGARALMVSNWPVETVSARLLTTDVFRRQAADGSLSRAEALRAAMLHMLDSEGPRDAQGRLQFAYAHPMFWAPFALIGDGR